MNLHRFLTFSISVLLLAVICPLTFGGEIEESEEAPAHSADEWKLRVTPYFWAPAFDGDSTVDGGTVSLDLDFSDFLDNFDVFGVMGHVEAWRGDWGFIFDAMYVDLDGDFDVPLRLIDETNAQIEQVNVDFAVSRRLATVSLKEGYDVPWISFEAIGGGRYVYLKQQVRLRPVIPPPGPKLGGSEDWVEPFVGGRITMAVSEKWQLLMKGDVGGFGIGSASDLTWNLIIGASYRLSERTSLELAYRIYDIDYERGSGANAFGLDTQLDGPVIGVSFYF